MDWYPPWRAADDRELGHSEVPMQSEERLDERDRVIHRGHPFRVRRRGVPGRSPADRTLVTYSAAQGEYPMRLFSPVHHRCPVVAPPSRAQTTVTPMRPAIAEDATSTATRSSPPGDARQMS